MTQKDYVVIAEAINEARQDFLTREPFVIQLEAPATLRARLLARPAATHCWVCKESSSWLYDCDGCGHPTCSDCLTEQISHRGEDYSGCEKCEQRTDRSFKRGRRFPRRDS